MPFTRPTLTELRERILADIASRLPSSGGSPTTLLRRSLAGVLGTAEAGAVHSLYGYLVFIARQALPDTAEGEYLLRWAAIFLSTGRKAATYAAGNRAVQVTGTVGRTLPQGTKFVRSDGIQYETTEELTLGGTTGTVSVRATTPGTTANTAPGISLQLLQPVAGFESGALVVLPGIIGGVNQESEEELRARLLARIKTPPQGGSADDYETWALEVPGVTRAWVYPMQMGPGTVVVLIADDNAATAPIPDASTVAAAQIYIETMRPVTAEVYVAAPTTLAVNIAAKLSPNTASTRAAALSELKDLFYRDAAPGQSIKLSKIREAISIASGVQDSEVTSPTTNPTGGTGQMPVLGTVTWSDF